MLSPYLSRSNDDSYARGVLSDKAYERGKARSLISIKMCMISWIIELFGTSLTVSLTFLRKFGFRKIHYPYLFIMYVVIPFTHLMNDEETKGIIAEENWLQGTRHMLGLYVEPKPNNET